MQFITGTIYFMSRKGSEVQMLTRSLSSWPIAGTHNRTDGPMTLLSTRDFRPFSLLSRYGPRNIMARAERIIHQLNDKIGACIEYEFHFTQLAIGYYSLSLSLSTGSKIIDIRLYSVKASEPLKCVRMCSLCYIISIQSISNLSVREFFRSIQFKIDSKLFP